MSGIITGGSGGGREPCTERDGDRARARAVYRGSLYDEVNASWVMVTIRQRDTTENIAFFATSLVGGDKGRGTSR